MPCLSHKIECCCINVIQHYKKIFSSRMTYTKSICNATQRNAMQHNARTLPRTKSKMAATQSNNHQVTKCSNKICYDTNIHCKYTELLTLHIQDG